MIRIIVIAAILFLVFVFIRQLRNYLARDQKIEELKETRLDTHMKDIDKEIAKEKRRQEELEAEIQDIKTEKSKHNKEEDQ
ncbi:hypothetical protein [Simiduia aestuariiviva]|uniref:Putative membrane protein YhiD involved in acid resistance n=1 Tax=Simiduia aestuariiviva TaxID=1510459 RepID=A0A839UWL9_9GAMM|nr:hypothetical protein [Simiduia aestuariiviva]MBB3169725.1 putative membrane protein YhiD involved in acid resistance [Simiduia aestuariiviva]